MKLEQAARQALVALEDVMADFDGSWALADTAITALREALAEPKKPEECANGCPQLQVCDYCQIAEQAGQPVAYKYKESSPETGEFVFAEQAEQEPVACIIHTEEGDYLDWNSKGYCFYTGETPLYAAHVRTKDLTDVEIAALVQRHTIDGKIMPFALCEAVIAADREKNRGTA